MPRLYSVQRPRPQSIVAPPPQIDALGVEDLRARAILARVPVSAAVAGVLAGLAYGSPETWRAAR